MDYLRKLIRKIILENSLKEKEELLVEPDDVNGEDEKEVSAGGVAGAATPLGTGPHYPNKKNKKINRKNAYSAASKAFANAKTVSKNK